MKYQPHERKSALRPPFPSRFSLLALALLILLAGCFPLPYKNLDPRCDTWRKKDFSTINDASMSVEDEFELLLCIRSHAHPDSIFFMTADTRLAEMGQNAVPFLKRKLSETDNSFVISNIVDVFGRMNDIKIYNFRAYNALTDTIISAILRMSRDKERERRIFLQISPESYKKLMTYY
jgi:hypothetical protein